MTDAGRTRLLAFRLPQSEIHYVRNVLEGYEGLATQTSRPGSNVVVWEVPLSRLEEALVLFGVLAEELAMERIEDDDRIRLVLSW
ncbi:MAG: hypothetical protein J7M25_08980 [Deltaproteobacteria bacterium]|nr:hypothetical protein [Deltaproteobacteria bacterium]